MKTGTVNSTNKMVHDGSKGQKVTIIKSFFCNGEGHYLTEEIGEIPDMFVDEDKTFEMKSIKIREKCFNNLFNNILSVNYAEDWEMFETDDKSSNPIVILKTKKWYKLLQLIENWLNKNRTKEFTDTTTKQDLIVGSLVGLKHSIKLYVRG